MGTRIIRDSECSTESPVHNGHPCQVIYGNGLGISPLLTSKYNTTYERKIFLPQLLPLEAYDLFIVLFSGGKDSIASYLRLLELGVSKNKIELWHHDVDGKHPTRHMDWPVTQAYVQAFAKAENVKLRVSYRVNGFFGELYRIGASYPIEYEDEGEIKTCRLTQAQIESDRIRGELLHILTSEEHEILKEYGQRMKFPAKRGDLRCRWCSVCLKCSVGDAVLRHLEEINCANKNILVVSGERRGESAGRAKYNEMEIHRTNATAKSHRLVHQWRAVIDYSLRDVWEILRRHEINPHPSYSCGWNRCSCMCCIFSRPEHWAGIKELFPNEFDAFRDDEIRLGFTLDNKKTLDEYVGNAKSCVYRGDPQALRQLTTGHFTADDVYQMGTWKFPIGAFKGSAGGPC